MIPTHSVGDIVYQWRRPGNPGVVIEVIPPKDPLGHRWTDKYPSYRVRYASGRTSTASYYNAFMPRLNQMQSQLDKMRDGLDALEHPRPRPPRIHRHVYRETGEPE